MGSASSTGWDAFSTTYRVFKAECATQFRFLHDDFGFRLVEMFESGRAAYVLYTNATTGVRIEWDVWEEVITLYVIRLIARDTIGPRDPERWRSLEALMRYYEPDWRPPQQSPALVIGELEMRAILAEFAGALHRNGGDIL